MSRTSKPEDILADIQAWRERSDRLIADIARRDTPPQMAHRTVTLTPEKRRLADMFRKKESPFEVSAATINSALNRVRKGRQVRSDITDFPEDYAGGGRMDILRWRRDRDA